MKTEANELLTFHLTGERPEGGKNDPTTLKLCPALLNSFRDLTRIRHDYPLVLVDGQPDRPVRSLSSIVNATLQAIAPRGITGERMRKNLISLEGEIRTLASDGGRGSLNELWSKAADTLLSSDGLSAEDREALEKNLARARSSLPGDGRLLAWLRQHGEVLHREVVDTAVVQTLRLPEGLVHQIDGVAEASYTVTRIPE